MSPRPRKASDEEIFAAAHRVMMRVGPEQFTLAEIAGEAGLTAGALVQRFGSKLGLLRAIAGQLTEGSATMLDEIRASHRSPLAAVHAYGACLAQMGESPGGIAHHLAWLQLDLTDDEMHRHLTAQARIARERLQRWLSEAVEAGELDPLTDVVSLARAVQVTLTGSLLGSAFEDEKPTAAMRRDLTAVLRPFLRGRPPARTRGKGRKSPGAPRA